MKITRLPDKYEPNKILKEKIIEKCRICPCCGESKLCTLQDELNAINEGKKYLEFHNLEVVLLLEDLDFKNHGISIFFKEKNGGIL